MKAAIYTRVSTACQAQNGESLDMQKERLIAYVKSQGWELFKIFEDGGYSGKNTERPAFRDMMKAAERRMFDVLVVYKIDRLSRSILDFHTTIESLKKNKVSFVSVTQQFDTTTSTGRLMLAILVDFANFEREIDADRAIDAFHQRRANGLTSGAIPYGYKRLEGNNVVIVEDEAETVRHIYDLALQNLSINEIARRTGFTKYHIRSIVTNPFYCGFLVQRRNKENRRVLEKDWQWFEAKHEPIINIEMYKQAAEIRKHKSRATSVIKNVRLFSKLIYCPYCDHNLTFHTDTRKKGEKSFYYLCEPIRLGGIYCSQYVHERYLEEKLLIEANKLVLIKHPRQKKDISQKKIKELDQKIGRLVKLAEQSRDLQSISKRINDLKKERKELITEPAEKEVDYKEIVKYIKELNEVYPYMSREEKNYFWHILIKKITAKREEFLVEWNGFGTSVIPRDKQQKKNLKTPQVWRRGEDFALIKSPGSSLFLDIFCILPERQ